MTATVYLVRHGRTALNAQGRLRGLADPPLDSTGEQQALAAAGVLRALPVHAVVCSPLQRARRTAVLIAEAARARSSSTTASPTVTTDSGPVTCGQTSKAGGEAWTTRPACSRSTRS